MSLSVDDLFEVGDTIYVNQKGLEYLLEEFDEEWVNQFAYTSALFIESVHADEYNPEDSLYYTQFADDTEKWTFELNPHEVSDMILESPVEKREYQLVFGSAKLDTSPMPIETLSKEQFEREYYSQWIQPSNNPDIIDNYFEQKGQELGALVDRKQKAYGNAVQQTHDVIKVLMKPYLNDNGTYTIPESLLLHLLLQVRIIDKQNRIFNNPDADLMDESPYKDLAGYGLLGEKLTDIIK